MVAFDDLNTQNHHLSELAQMLLYLFRERSMCDKAVTCSLLYRFLQDFQEHVDQVSQFYPCLLSAKEEKINNTARMFLSGAQELDRIIAAYTKAWCDNKRQQLRVAEHERFIADSEELFRMVLARIQDETEHLYPLVRMIQDNSRSAA